RGRVGRVTAEPQVIDSRVVTIRRGADPELIGPALASLDDDGRVILEIDLPLPEKSLAAAAAALEGRPEITLVVDRGLWDITPSPSLDWVEQFPHLQNLVVAVFDAVDFSPIRHLHELRTLHVGETRRRSLSLAFLAETPLIERLSIDGTGGRDF